MERTKFPANNKLTTGQLHTLASAMMARMGLASKLGMQYGGDRDVYQALGYAKDLTYDDYYARYLRQDIAKAIIDRPVKATWQGDLELIETEDAQLTPFESAWKKLNWDLGLKTRLSRVDRLTGIGHYGVLFLGLDDTSNKEGLMSPVKPGTRKLKFVKPFGEDSAKISTYEVKTSNPRYGMPVLYDIKVSDVASGYSSTIKVHYSRVIHITDDNLESEVVGTPRLESVFNRLFDLEKIVGGDAEMYWRGARPGFRGKVDKDYTVTPTTEAGLQDQFKEYENDLRRFLLAEGVDIEALDQQIVDPKSHLDVQLTCISAVTGIPKRILSGSERGELASTQDAGEWKTYVQSRREDQAEPCIIRPFVDRLIELGVLPTPKEFYRIDWLDLFSISEAERVNIGKGRANAIREYTTNPMAEAMIPIDLFLETCLGYSSGQIELARKMRSEGISDEQKDLMKEVKELTEPTPPPVGSGQPANKSTKKLVSKPA